jgi:hypothetical protein
MSLWLKEGLQNFFCTIYRTKSASHPLSWGGVVVFLQPPLTMVTERLEMLFDCTGQMAQCLCQQLQQQIPCSLRCVRLIKHTLYKQYEGIKGKAHSQREVQEWIFCLLLATAQKYLSTFLMPLTLYHLQNFFLISVFFF